MWKKKKKNKESEGKKDLSQTLGRGSPFETRMKNIQCLLEVLLSIL